jgi:hypothetical protein
MRRWGLVLSLAAVLALPPVAAVGQGDARSRVLNAPQDRVWGVTRSVLTSLGWKVDKEDPAVGWIVTESRRVDGEDYGVYAKGVKHRLRVTIKGVDQARTAVTVERRVWREERILWMDKEEELPVADPVVEKQVLDAIARSV